MVKQFLVFVFKPPMFVFMLLSNIAVTILTSEQRGLWYTPLAITVLALTILYTRRKYYRKPQPTITGEQPNV